MGLGGLFFIVLAPSAQAQIDAFTFFIPYPADSFDDQLALGLVPPPAPPAFINQPIETIISIVAARDNTIIYYDHWEDGYEPILTSPTQPTTEVWGDGDLTNGVAPGIPTDIIDATNRVITLQQIIPLPRDSNNIFYDGSDKLTAVGGNIAVSTSNWKVGTPSILYSDSWELYATERWGTSYIVPAGTDIAALRAGFTVTLINVQAAQDGTSVTIDLNDGSPPTTVVLDEGQSFAQTSGTANSGASVQASAPVQVHIFSTDPTSRYEARGYTLVPRSQWSGDYIAPRSSDGNFLLYNPDTAALDVQVITETNIVSIVTIPAQSASLVPGGGSLSPATGTRFTSTDGRPFYGLAALDAASTQDWGYSLLPFRNLTTQYLIGWAPGNCHSAGPDTAPDICPTAPAGNEFGSRLYVTAGTTTTIVVDYQNNGLITDTFVISRNAEIPIFDPNPNPDNRDLTGAYLYSVDNTPFAIVWGQDQGANPALPSLDLGTAIVPLATINLNKSIVLLVDADNSGTPTWGDTIRFDIFVTNNSNSDLTPTVIEDTIPTEITYLPGTTTVNGTPVPDSGTTPVPLDEGGLSIPLGPRQSTTISFQATINSNTSSVANSACADAPGGLTACDTAEIPEIRTAAFELDKRVIDPVDGLTQNGDLVTYQITITSTGNISITTMPLVDDYDETQMSFDSATPTEDSNDPVAGTTTWNDLTTTFGPLLPNDVISVTVRMRVGNVPDGGSTIQNTACVDGAQGSDGAPLAQQCDTAEIIVPPIAAAYEFDKRLVAPANGESDAGETVTFGLIITSTGNLTITAMTLTDTVDQNYLTFLNSTPPPTSNNPGVTVWDIVGIFGEMVPKRTVSLTVTYPVANPLPAGARNTTNSATVDGVQDANGNILPPQTGTATVNFPPTPTPTPSGGGNDDDDDGEPPPTGVPTVTPDPGQPVAFVPPGGPEPGATPTLPVSLLPETGNREGSGGLLFGLLALAGLSLLILFVRAKLNGPSHSSEG
jgi:uncharacterized repeat protein (TIGR01451 family)